MDFQVTLTRDECEFIHEILFSCVGGDPRGPRVIGEAIAAKLPTPGRRRYRAEIVESTVMGRGTGRYRVEVTERNRERQ